MRGRIREIAGVNVPAVGLGCMNLSHAYGAPPPKEQAERVLQKALDIGITHFDSAALYGFGRNEELVGPFLKRHRDRIFLVSKCGLRGVDGKRVIDGRPGMLQKDIEERRRSSSAPACRCEACSLGEWGASVELVERRVEGGRLA